MDCDIPTQRVTGVNFRFYNAEEILALSVKEISNPQTFDTLMHPTTGGLYDSALGPTDKDDACGTCGQNFVHCPGHMGHIRLPLPTYNPVYFKLLYQILKGSCFNCHRLTVQPIAAHLFAQKFVLLDHGLLPFVSEMEDYASHLMEEMGKDVRNEDHIKSQLSEMVEKIISDAGNQTVTAKNIEAVRAEVRSEFISENFKLQGSCPHCKKRKAAIRQEHQSKILITGISTSATPSKDKPGKKMNDENSDDSGNESEEDELRKEEIRLTKDKTGSKKSVDSQRKFITAAEAREHMRLVWKRDQCVLRNLYRSLNSNTMKYPTDVFFLDVIPVPPCRFRPISVLHDKRFENPQTANLCRLLVDSAIIKQLLQLLDEKQTTDGPQPTAISETPGQTIVEKLQNAWVRLQTHVNCVVDSELDKISTDKHPGIKQLLEKKEGLFRKHMMGKRVNFAARSVISPDPCISTNEIGVPEVFAKKLTYPQPVTPWNVHELRQAVINGPQVHPGACFVVNEDGSKVLLNMKDKTQREAIAKQLLTPLSGRRAHLECKQVYRHLKNGDVLLVNRQPTLHRPSIQAHKARVLPGEKTLRLHYSNCKAYNADFDGDEMNAHFPQNELARSEAYTIASTDFQYLVPKDGTPLAGLIQDHMVSGVSISIRGRFFNRQDYCQLVYTALVDRNGPVKLLSPAMVKPYLLWSGKQVLSTILLNVIPEGKKPLNLIGKSKIPEKSWMSDSARLQPGRLDLSEMGESSVVIRGGELLCGVLDKGHYGNTPYGLVHCCYELYGGAVAGRILTCLGRLFMNFLQQLRSFTLGVEDILVTPKADDKRDGAIIESTHCGPEAAAEALGLSQSADEHVMLKALKNAHFNKDDRQMRELDLSMKGKTDNIQNQIVGACMPKGLGKLFPENNLQLMVQSGAKGSSVNCMQISALLGQIELEGRRPPLMLSGKTLPSFMPYDTSPRAGGFVSGRFLTGIRPQEYFFHCMAGREGLIDTAVKTSRSGYLQRCLIKHLEGVMVNYDLTVRDSDGSIVQFYYGEDGLDIQKTGFLTPKQYPFLLENRAVLERNQPMEADELYDKKVKKWTKKINKWRKRQRNVTKYQRSTGFLKFCENEGNELSEDTETISKNGHTEAALKLCQLWQDLDDKSKQKLGKYCGSCPDPVMALYMPFQRRGVFPEKFVKNLQSFYETKISQSEDLTDLSKDDFFRLMFNKQLSSLAQPGEAVGLLCAQSIGEPSTQMTLNTFHFAGRGEMNVTLGIPRLREILMVASANIKTPSMDIPVLNTPEAKAKAKELQIKLNRVMLSEVLEDVSVCEYLSIKSKSQRTRVFEVKFQFLPRKCYKGRLHVTPKKILSYMEKVYFKHFVIAIRKKISELQKARLTSSGTIKQFARESQTFNQSEDVPGAQEEEESSDLEDNDGNAAAVKERQKMEEEKEYEEEEEEGEGQDAVEDVDVEMEDSNSRLEESGLIEDEMDGIQPIQSTKQTENNRVNMVLQSNSCVSNYRYDVKREQWCEITLEFGILDSKIDLPSLIDNNVRSTVVYEVPGITRCFLSEEKNGNEMELHLKTEGINILEMYFYRDILDVSRLYSNDIHAIASQYGIEAANKVIIKEIQNVFAAYGIEVDYRHLSLLGDYMTFEGAYKPFNRMAIETCPSPLQKMSFETTMHFLTNASIQGSVDKLKSPSSQIVAGRVVSCGSGTFEVLQPLC